MEPMRYSKDKTLSEGYIRMMVTLISEYEAVKNHTSLLYKTCNDFYVSRKICRQNFLKFYNRFKQSGGDKNALLPQKRGPKYRVRRADLIRRDELVLEARKSGNNKYEIRDIIRVELGDATPSPSTIYNILRKNGKNKLKVVEKETKKKIIKEKLGELGHMDCHYLPLSIVLFNRQKHYLVGLIDDCSRICWCKRVTSLKSLDVMFATMQCISVLRNRYGIDFEVMMTDNGAEFGGGCKTEEAKNGNPFKRLMQEMGIKHIHTKPYRPQTNGKIERFWRIIEEDFIEETAFESAEELDHELNIYMIYYNEHRPHQALNGKTPKQFADEIRKKTNA